MPEGREFNHTGAARFALSSDRVLEPSLFSSTGRGRACFLSRREFLLLIYPENAS